MAVVGFVIGVYYYKITNLDLAKVAIQAGSHIFKKRQETKMMMADAQHHHAMKMAKGDIEYQGKLLEARQSDWKDEFVLVVLTLRY